MFRMSVHSFGSIGQKFLSPVQKLSVLSLFPPVRPLIALPPERLGRFVTMVNFRRPGRERDRSTSMYGLDPKKFLAWLHDGRLFGDATVEHQIQFVTRRGDDGIADSVVRGCRGAARAGNRKDPT